MSEVMENIAELKRKRAVAEAIKNMSSRDTFGVGCGIYPLLLKRTKFIAACEFHDRTYEDQSWAQLNLTRKEVDNWFLDQMLLIAGDSKLRKVQAYAFFGIARVLGGLWWEGKR